MWSLVGPPQYILVGSRAPTSKVTGTGAPSPADGMVAGAGPIVDAWPPYAGSLGFVWLKLPWNVRPSAPSPASWARAFSRSARTGPVTDATWVVSGFSRTEPRLSPEARAVSSDAARRSSLRSDRSRLVVAGVVA